MQLQLSRVCSKVLTGEQSSSMKLETWIRKCNPSC